jgi:molybdate transport system substrate-binding protein
MKGISGVIACLFAAPLAAHSFAATPPKADERATLTVFAAASLAEPFGELGKMLESSHPGLQVRFNFAGSQQLAAQIEQGASADLFASADERWMEHLALSNKLEGGPRVFAHNGLVVIVPKSNPARIHSLPELAKRGVKVVVGSHATPVGMYSREVLRRLGLGPDFVPDYAQRVMANVVSEEDNVKSVVTKVQLGEADAGMVYRSDLTPSVARNVRVFELPPAAQIVASYPIAALKGSAHTEAAQAFLALLASKEGQAVLERHRLTPATAAAP